MLLLVVGRDQAQEVDVLIRMETRELLEAPLPGAMDDHPPQQIIVRDERVCQPASRGRCAR